MRRALAHRGHEETGATLAEVIITLGLLTILGTILLSAVIGTFRGTRKLDDESTGLSDVQTIVERLGRDLRQSRGVLASTTLTCPVAITTATQSKLSIWVDLNSDYVPTCNELITWSLVASSGGHFNVQRTDANGASKVEGRTLINQLAFKYDGLTTPPAATRVVTVDMTYDPLITRGTTARHQTMTVRMRNVP